MNNVFDVQVAEKILSGKIENYANIVEKYTKVKLDKNETNSNWLKDLYPAIKKNMLLRMSNI